MKQGRKGPQKLKKALEELIARRGLAQGKGRAELAAAWRAAAGPEVSANTRLLSYRGGVVEIGVRHAALLNRLKSFEHPLLLARLQEQEEKIRDLKFRLSGDIPEA